MDIMDRHGYDYVHVIVRFRNMGGRWKFEVKAPYIECCEAFFVVPILGRTMWANRAGRAIGIGTGL